MPGICFVEFVEEPLKFQRYEKASTILLSKTNARVVSIKGVSVKIIPSVKVYYTLVLLLIYRVLHFMCVLLLQFVF